MFTIFIGLLYLIITGFGIYFFDYRIDMLVNNVIIVFASIFLGLLLTVFIVWVLLESFSLILPKDKIQKSLFTHKLLKQIVSVPIHLSLMRIKVIGGEHLPKNTGFTIYSNHNSWIDPIIIAYGLYNYPVAALGKEGAFNLPVVGKYAPKFGCVLIHRKDPRQSADAIKKVIKHVEDGLAMVIFPEGTRNSNTHSLLDFKAGAFKVALRTGKPLVPITLIKHKKKRFINKVTVQIHNPLPFDDYKFLKTNEIAEKVKNIINSSL
jgi:1-acyl-sn-glycerol-3-phosphate acyltransferase